MKYSLCIQATYKQVDIALCKGSAIIESIALANHDSSALLIVHIDLLLKTHSLTLADCTYLAVNQGPAPFTTLRTILATANGIHAATQIPLVGVDGLTGLLKTNHNDHTTIVLLNAFNNELYYAVPSTDTIITGYGSFEKIVSLIQKTIGDKPVGLIGNGVELLKSHNPSFFENKTIILDFFQEYCTISDIAQLAEKQWHTQHDFNTPLMPMYLKKHAAELK